MQGRYGTDDLAKFLLGTVVAVMILDVFVRVSTLNLVVVALIGYIYFRMFSTNIQARYKENLWYLEKKNRVMGFFGLQKRKAQDLKVNHIYKCPSCGQKIRIPRGKGKIVVTCPKCRHEFTKKS